MSTEGNSNAGKPKEDTETAFTVDGSSDPNMPSVTKLLNRKRLKSPPPLTQNPRPDAPPPPASSTAPQKELPEVSPKASPQTSEEAPQKPPSSVFEVSLSSDAPTSIEIESSKPPSISSIEVTLVTPPPPVSDPTLVQVQPATHRKADPAAVPTLALWDLALLKAGKDPLGKAIAHLLEKGASSALFMAIQAPPPGSLAPHFMSTAASVQNLSSQKEKIVLWTGLKWDPTVVPELWNYFVKAGSAELAPPSTHTNQASSRNVVRAAFGVEKTEWLLLVRAGSSHACRGVIAFTSKQSLTQILNLAEFNAP